METINSKRGLIHQIPNHFASIEGGILFDIYGGQYSEDGKTLIVAPKDRLSYEVVNGTTTIGEWAFRDSQIETVFLPDSLTTIEYGAFADCKHLMAITLPKYITEIKSSAFEGCSQLKEIILPRHLQAISCRTFRDCTALANVYIPDCVEYIDLAAFEGCEALTSIIVPNFATVESFAFQGCSSLKAISLPVLTDDQVIGDGILEGTALNKLYYPYNAIPNRMFAQSKLEELDIWGKLHYVDDSAFYFCHSLRRVVFHCCADADNQPDFSNFWRFSKKHKIEFIIPQGSEACFKRLFIQAANNPEIKITAMDPNALRY